MRKLIIAGCTAGAVLLAGCAGPVQPEGLRRTPAGDGPVVEWNLDARPFPEIPFPNDVGTRLDPSSPTGRRVNVSTVASTQLESRVRQKLDRLSGFGTYSPITVAFSAPLDIANIVSRHRVNDFRNDTVLLINITPKSPDFGRAVPIDLGDGNIPFVLPKKDNYFENDPDYAASSIVFSDSNVVHPGGNPDYDLMTFYERATNTLIVRPILPLEEESAYAVVLTGKLVGQNGQPVRSPFPYINHLDQTEALRPLVDILPRYGLTVDDVAFTWSFTTQGTTRDLVAIRKGLYGRGPLGWLANQFPGTLGQVLPLNTFTDSSRYIVTTDRLFSAFMPLLQQLAGTIPSQDVQALLNGYRFVDYFVAGSYATPYFLTDRDGMAASGFPDDENEVFDVDPLSGRAVVGPSQVSFICAIPKPGPWGTPPFPVVFYGHGYTSFKIEMFGFAGAMARFGLATCGIDAVGHGNCLDKTSSIVVKGILSGAGLGPVLDVFTPARARDLSNSGTCKSGGDFWTADTFHTSDVVRQTIVDHMQLIRILRGFDGKKTWAFDPIHGNGGSGIAGDFNGDGVPDIGGPANGYYAWGISLGGIISSVLPGIEPAIRGAAPVSGGSGLADIGIRSVQGGVVEAVFLRIMGPFVAGDPMTTGTTQLKFLAVDVNDMSEIPFARVTGISEGDTIVVTNKRSGKTYSTTAIASSCYDPRNANHQWRAVLGPCFRVSFAADAARAGVKRVKLGITLEDTQNTNYKGTGKPFSEVGKSIADPLQFGDPIVIEVRDGTTGRVKTVVDKVQEDYVFQGGHYLSGTALVAPAEGFGLTRNTPDLRRFMSIAETILEPGDPVSFAPHYFRDPINYLDVDPGLPMGSNVLDVPTVGDMNVPVNSGIATARAAGMIPLFQKDLRTFTVSTTGQTFTADMFSLNDILLKGFAVEGLSRLNRYTDSYTGAYGGPLLDIDNLSEGHDFTSTSQIGYPRVVPRLTPPLRITVPTPTGVSGMRIPYVNPNGQHGFDLPHPKDDFDIDTYMVNLIARFFQTGGGDIADNPCLEMTGRYSGPCPFIPLLSLECQTFAAYGYTCTSVSP